MHISTIKTQQFFATSMRNANWQNFQKNNQQPFDECSCYGRQKPNNNLFLTHHKSQRNLYHLKSIIDNQSSNLKRVQNQKISLKKRLHKRISSNQEAFSGLQDEKSALNIKDDQKINIQKHNISTPNSLKATNNHKIQFTFASPNNFYIPKNDQRDFSKKAYNFIQPSQTPQMHSQKIIKNDINQRFFTSNRPCANYFFRPVSSILPINYKSDIKNTNFGRISISYQSPSHKYQKTNQKHQHLLNFSAKNISFVQQNTKKSQIKEPKNETIPLITISTKNLNIHQNVQEQDQIKLSYMTRSNQPQQNQTQVSNQTQIILQSYIETSKKENLRRSKTQTTLPPQKQQESDQKQTLNIKVLAEDSNKKKQFKLIKAIKSHQCATLDQLDQIDEHTTKSVIDYQTNSSFLKLSVPLQKPSLLASLCKSKGVQQINQLVQIQSVADSSQSNSDAESIVLGRLIDARQNTPMTPFHKINDQNTKFYGSAIIEKKFTTFKAQQWLN